MPPLQATRNMADLSWLKWLWLGIGFLGVFIAVRGPDKLVFDKSFWGTIGQTMVSVAMPLWIMGGPFTLVLALLLPKKKLCPHCYKAIRVEATTCPHCAEPVPLSSLDSNTESSSQLMKPRFSPEVHAAIFQGFKWINLPVMLIMLGTISLMLISGLLISSVIIMGISLPVGLILGWLWWSYSVPRWRKWALAQPGVEPDALQTAAEVSGLVWPKGHFLEKTEFKLKE